jgi:hypothetical protein
MKQPARGNPISALMHNVFRMVNVQLLFIVMDDAGIDIFLEDVDVRAGEFPGANAALEEEVEFGEGAALRFGDAKVGVDDAAEADAGLYLWSAVEREEGYEDIPRRIRCSCPSSMPQD